jgi:geranylgeranyl diphosphate synthase type II
LSQSFQHVAEHTKGVELERVLDVLVRLGKSVGAKGLVGGQVMDLVRKFQSKFQETDLEMPRKLKGCQSCSYRYRFFTTWQTHILTALFIFNCFLSLQECEGKPVDDVTIDDLRWIHTHKTATLLQVAVASGAILGGARQDEVKACEKFALNIGLAFQVADDILDVTQSTEELGKTAGKDENTEKSTFPRLLGLEGSRKEAERLVAEAKEAMKPFGDRAIPLLGLADFIINRKN